MIDDSHCAWTHLSHKAFHCFNNGYVGKQLVDWKEYCTEYWLKEFQDSKYRCTGCRNITEIIVVKHHSINHCYGVIFMSVCLSFIAENSSHGAIYKFFIHTVTIQNIDIDNTIEKMSLDR